MAEHNDIGKIGEALAKSFLVKHNFSIVETNYRTKYGEIDIIAQKDNKLRFIEVKSVKVRDISYIKNLKVNPEDNLTMEKWRKMIISIETYLKHKNILNKTKHQIDLACIYINIEKREGRVKFLENIYKE